MSKRISVGLAAIGAAFVVRYAWVVSIHWINDDFIFLDHVRKLGFADLWGMNDALGNAYRPLSRNVYFWLCRAAFGTDPAGFHVVNLLIALTGLVLCFLVCRHLLDAALDAGAPGNAAAAGNADGMALLATLLFAAHPAAATPVAWTCGIQDLLVVTLSFAALLAYLQGRRILYPLCFTAALLSKETAVVVPVLLGAFDWLVRRRRLRQAVDGQLGAVAILALWMVGNRWLPWHDLGATIHSAEPGTRTLFGRLDWQTVLVATRALFLVEPFEHFEWPYGIPVTVALIALQGAALIIAAGDRWAPVRPALAVVAGLWIILGIAPLITVVSRFVYYAYLPSIGLALGLVVALSRLSAARQAVVRTAAAGVVLALLTVASGFRYPAARCDAHNIRRASGYLWTFRSDMLAAHPTLPDSASVYFWNIPVHIGFQLADGPALRTWYDNPTLSGHFLREYTGDDRHPSFFFGHDDRGHLVEIIPGEPDPQLAAPPSIYAIAHSDLGTRLAMAGRPDAAIIEWRKALQVDPTLTEALSNLALTLVERGRHREAIAILPQAIAANPAQSELKLSFGFALAAEGEVGPARDWIERFLREAPDSAYRQRALELLSYLETGRPSGDR